MLYWDKEGAIVKTLASRSVLTWLLGCYMDTVKITYEHLQRRLIVQGLGFFFQQTSFTGPRTQQSSHPEHMLYDLQLTKSIKRQVFSMLTWKKSCKFMAANSNQHKSSASSPSSQAAVVPDERAKALRKAEKWDFYRIQSFSWNAGKYTHQYNWQFIHSTCCSYLILTSLSNWQGQMPFRQLPRW